MVEQFDIDMICFVFGCCFFRYETVKGVNRCHTDDIIQRDQAKLLPSKNKRMKIRLNPSR